MGSKRLPKKSLMNLFNQSLLSTVINSVKRNDFIDDIVVATTELSEDDAIEKECNKLGINCLRGDAENVLSRFIDVAKNCRPEDTIVRVTADNPINNKKVSQFLYKTHISSEADYTCVKGLSHTVYEYVKVKALLDLQKKDNLKADDKEHVTMYIRNHPELFKVISIAPEDLGINTALDKLLTIDTKEDYQRVLKVAQQIDIDKNYKMEDVYSVLKSHIGLA